MARALRRCAALVRLADVSQEVGGEGAQERHFRIPEPVGHQRLFSACRLDDLRDLRLQGRRLQERPRDRIAGLPARYDPRPDILRRKADEKQAYRHGFDNARRRDILYIRNRVVNNPCRNFR